MSTFDNRERAEENRFAHDQELAFKARVKRARLLAAWAGPQIGRTDIAAYGDELIDADMKQPGDEDIIAQLLADFAAANVETSRHVIEVQLQRLGEEAKAAVLAQG
ncbi:DUF1476 domain-containing protein [Tistrella mobilis]